MTSKDLFDLRPLKLNKQKQYAQLLDGCLQPGEIVEILSTEYDHDAKEYVSILKIKTGELGFCGHSYLKFLNGFAIIIPKPIMQCFLSGNQ